jgi:hypothetical protein
MGSPGEAEPAGGGGAPRPDRALSGVITGVDRGAGTVRATVEVSRADAPGERVILLLSPGTEIAVQRSDGTSRPGECATWSPGRASRHGTRARSSARFRRSTTPPASGCSPAPDPWGRRASATTGGAQPQCGRAPPRRGRSPPRNDAGAGKCDASTLVPGAGGWRERHERTPLTLLTLCETCSLCGDGKRSDRARRAVSAARVNDCMAPAPAGV